MSRHLPRRFVAPALGATLAVALCAAQAQESEYDLPLAQRPTQSSPQSPPSPPPRPPQPPRPTQPQLVAGLPLWELGVIGGAVSTPAYSGAQDRSSRRLVLPYLIYRGKVLRSDGSGIGARLVNTDRLELNIGFAASLPARSSDVAARAGMPDLGTLVEFGPRVKYRLARLNRSSVLRIEAPLRTVIEMRSGVRRQGWAFEPKLVYEKTAGQDAWSLDATLGLVFGSAALNRYFYEVEPRFATPARPAYSARAGLMLVRGGLSASYQLSADVRLYSFLRYDSYANAVNRASPLLRQSSGSSAGLGLSWTLSRSSRRAAPEPVRAAGSWPE
jgi:outer membrane protein